MPRLFESALSPILLEVPLAVICMRTMQLLRLVKKIQASANKYLKYMPKVARITKAALLNDSLLLTSEGCAYIV